MLVGISGSGTTEGAAKTIKKILEDSGMKSFPIAKSKSRQA